LLAGHYAPAYLLRAKFPQIPLLAFFLAVQAPDIVFFILVPLGIEHVRVNPAVRGPLGMDLVSIPYTHSLALTVVYGTVIVNALGLLWRRWRVGFALSLAVLSHWALDYIVHEHDLPLTTSDAVRLGLGLWSERALAYAFEVTLVVLSAIWLARKVPPGSARRWVYGSAVVLVLSQTNYVLTPPPATTLRLAINAELTYAFMALIAWMVDRRIATSTKYEVQSTKYSL
jgi:hypothetical protein